MTATLTISIGQATSKGRKDINQDFHGSYTPKEPLLSYKGIALAVADGISSSDVSQIASETAVSSFLEDYYCTSEAWSVKKSAESVLLSTNSWLHSQTINSQHRFNKDKGYVCTFSALILKSSSAYIFHVGDSRIYRLQENKLEQITKDHRLWVSAEKSYLSRALGIIPQLKIDHQKLPVEQDDIFILATDGIYEVLEDSDITQTIQENKHDLDKAANLILEQAYQLGSEDNLTLQIAKIDSLPSPNADEIYQQLNTLSFPPVLEARATFDGYNILREVYISPRSHVFLANDSETQQNIIIKTPSTELKNDASYLERFLMEEWIARRINNVHVLKAFAPTKKRNYIYFLTEYIEGKTLAQWMKDNPKPSVETVRNIVEQVAKGLQAFHRQEMVHQDLRPNNIMIDSNGTVKIIDFGAVRVAGLEEIINPYGDGGIPGTALYSAPEYFLGEVGTAKSDLFSLGVITYQMLSGKLPYGTEVAKLKSKSAQRKLRYRSVLDDDREIPAWLDETLRKAVHPTPLKRYSELSEFIYDLRHPNSRYLSKNRPPLLESNPATLWKTVSLLLVILLIVLNIYPYL